MSHSTCRPDLRQDLVRAIEGDTPEFVGELTDTTSLIQSGLVDSVRLVEIALFVEREIGRPIDLALIELNREWDTIPDILAFVESAHQRERALDRHPA